ncbi:MAG: glycosyltransferase [Acidimicrobiales bacterium]
MTGESALRVSLVHERFTELGGSEKVVDSMAVIWPNAHLFSPLIDRSVPSEALTTLPSQQSSRLQGLYRGSGRYAHLLPMLPMAMARAHLPESDVVVVSHHAFANRVRIAAGVPMVSYVHTPARWLWEPNLRAMDGSSAAHRALLTAFAATQRKRDRRAAQRPEVLIANSSAVANRIKCWWGRDSLVVHPPVAIDRFRPDPATAREPFFLLAGRLVPYKRPDIAIRAAVRAGVRLVVAGDGRARARCEAIAGPKVSFLGTVSDEQLEDLYRRCRALVFTGVEDFGLVPVEAQACGAPVIGLDEGGLRDTVWPGQTGVLVPSSQNDATLVDRFADAMAALRPSHFEAETIRAHAESFGEQRFQDAMRRIVEKVAGSAAGHESGEGRTAELSLIGSWRSQPCSSRRASSGPSDGI